MKYSELIFANKPADIRKAKIKKMERGIKKSANKEVLNKEKSCYVQEVVGVPEFEPAVSYLSQYTLDKGNQADIASITALNNRIRRGEFDYEDVGKLSAICDNNFKYIFSCEPEKNQFDGVFLGGAILSIGAIILRVSYEIANNQTLILFLAIINLAGFTYTVSGWPRQVIINVEEWMRKNNIHSSFLDKIIGRVQKRMAVRISLSVIIVIVGLIISAAVGYGVVGNDIVSIVALAVSIFGERIVIICSRCFEWEIYHNHE